MKTKHRHGDTMLLIESESAVVDFSDIVDSCRVEHDDYSEPPWEDCDGYKHEKLTLRHPESDDIDQIKVELAEECAAELVAQGYTVENRPTLADHRKEYLRNRKDGYKRNVTLF